MESLVFFASTKITPGERLPGSTECLLMYLPPTDLNLLMTVREYEVSF